MLLGQSNPFGNSVGIPGASDGSDPPADLSGSAHCRSPEKLIRDQSDGNPAWAEEPLGSRWEQRFLELRQASVWGSLPKDLAPPPK